MPDPPSGGDASARNPMTSPCINAPVVGPQPGEGRGKLRVLFFAEAVTLAHVTRPVVLARGLDPARFEVTLASEPRYHTLWREPRVAVRPIHSIPAERFLEALARGRPLYDVDTLRAYVREDLEVIRDTAPDVVVGDFRLSLSVSARVAKVPYLAIVNAYWSPYAHRRFPMPELPITKTIGVACAGRCSMPFAPWPLPTTPARWAGSAGNSGYRASGPTCGVLTRTPIMSSMPTPRNLYPPAICPPTITTWALSSGPPMSRRPTGGTTCHGTARSSM